MEHPDEAHHRIHAGHQAPEGGRVEHVGLDDLEEALIQHAVRESGGNLSGAARLLRITRPQLNYRLKKKDTNN